MVDAGGAAGPVSVSCTADGVDRVALVRLPFKVAVSTVVRKVVGVYLAARVQTPPTARAEGRVLVKVQSLVAVPARL